jgi:hypothetical protein
MPQKYVLPIRDCTIRPEDLIPRPADGTRSWSALSLEPFQTSPKVALTLMASVPLHLTWVGTLGSTRGRHALFKDCRAPLDFSGIEAIIEKYLNKVRPCLHFLEHLLGQVIPQLSRWHKQQVASTCIRGEPHAIRYRRQQRRQRENT